MCEQCIKEHAHHTALGDAGAQDEGGGCVLAQSYSLEAVDEEIQELLQRPRSLGGLEIEGTIQCRGEGQKTETGDIISYSLRASGCPHPAGEPNSTTEFPETCRYFGVDSQDKPLNRNYRLWRGSNCCLFPLTGALIWAQLLMWALAVPGSWGSLNEEQEELIVELHNYYRGQVSPSASAMLPLKWDSNLKVVAEGYAAKCDWNHNPNLEDTGENLFASTGPLDLRMALEKWFLEHLHYDYDNNSCPEDEMCGHYTQMVWADTHRVGCALHLCDTMEGLDFEDASFLVCNYYPAGNYEGEKPYVEGDMCSRCPENMQKCENNLCVADTEDGDEEEIASTTPLTTTTTPQPPIHPETTTSSTSTKDGVGPESPATLPPFLGTDPPDVPYTMSESPGNKEEETRREDVERMGEEKENESKGEEIAKANAASLDTLPVFFSIFLAGALTLRL
ncbi:peptidase inhibitor 16-like [Lampris incognitus]|uniref:peptidase inhibitor 16-like n=1 Tax=Lampris incognitus TaxID=2546036 RepID=UPI0024B557BC|nr:peptidase inhibitor 16-like [Lampris incognitus]